MRDATCSPSHRLPASSPIADITRAVGRHCLVRASAVLVPSTRRLLRHLDLCRSAPTAPRQERLTLEGTTCADRQRSSRPRRPKPSGCQATRARVTCGWRGRHRRGKGDTASGEQLGHRADANRAPQRVTATTWASSMYGSCPYTDPLTHRLHVRDLDRRPPARPVPPQSPAAPCPRRPQAPNEKRALQARYSLAPISSIAARPKSRVATGPSARTYAGHGNTARLAPGSALRRPTPPAPRTTPPENQQLEPRGGCPPHVRRDR